VEKFNFRTRNELGVKKIYQIKISNKFTALEKLKIARTHRVSENLKENIKKLS
jgi:hypothetical protein